MYDSTITLFNFHEDTGYWYPSVIPNVDLGCTKSRGASQHGEVNSDSLTALIHCTKDKQITTTAGVKSYMGAKEYAGCSDPSMCFTFKPECDFIFDGVWPELDPIPDEDFDSGLYHEMNDAYDGVYLISSVSYYGLLPHFEIGGR